MAQAVTAITVAQPHVAQHQIERTAVAKGLGLGAARRFRDLVVAPDEQTRQQGANRLLVLDEEGMAAHVGPGARRRGAGQAALGGGRTTACAGSVSWK